MSAENILEVRDLAVSFATDDGIVQAVDGVSFDLRAGEVLAVVGESGCGKTVTAMTLLGLTRSANARFSGTAHYEGTELIGASDAELRSIRGAEIAMVFQDAMAALNPVQRIGHQIAEQIRAHEDIGAPEARERTIALLERVGIPRARERVDAYPFEFSGGMRQRVMIALGLSCDPRILIADEPTTALDVTIQAQILERFRELREQTNAALVLVTHNLGVVADIADRVAVMYAGRIVEHGTLDEIFYDPQHPYTWGLLGAIPRIDRARPGRLPTIAGLPPSLTDRPTGCHLRPRCPHEFADCAEVPPVQTSGAGGEHTDRCWLPAERKAQLREIEPGEIGLPAKVTDAPPEATPAPREAQADDAGVPLLQIAHLKQHFPIRKGLVFDRVVGHVHAVDDVSFELRKGETLGLVGESGCGKTTLSRTIMRLIDPTDGAIRFRGDDVSNASRAELAPLRRDMQMVFQDPYASLNPRKRVGQIVGRPLRRHGIAREEADRRVFELLDRVGLAREHANRFPHEFSGGQRQRIGVARALALDPQLVVLDEPVSALDVSIQAQIVNLLEDLQDQLGLTYLFVAHDLSVVRHVSDRIAVMYLGRLMEVSPSEELYTKPIHHYSAALLEAIPIPDPRANRARQRTIVSGEPPNPIDPPSGCVFHPRCPAATDVCRTVVPPVMRYANDHLAACHHPLNVTAAEVQAAERSDASPLLAGDA